MLYKGTKIFETNKSFPFPFPSNPTIYKKTMLCPKDGSTYTGYMVRKKNGQTFPYYKANTKSYHSNVSASTVHLAYSNLLNEYRIPGGFTGTTKRSVI